MNIIFIDSQVTAPESLLTGLLPDIQAIVLDNHQDGIAQISSVLQQNPQIQTLHIVSHGSPGCLYLGNSQLNLTNIYQYQELLQHWNVKNIVLYGCNVAAGDAGEELLRKLYDITKAQITATATKTGHPKLGGNWHLEVNYPPPSLLNYPTPPLIRGAGGDQTLAFNAETLATYQGVFAPTLVGSWERLSYAYDVTIVGNYAYVVGDTFEIIDISDLNNLNPSGYNLIFKGSYDIQYGKAVQIVGNLAYIADYYSGLQIIDITNPATPTLKGSYDTSGFAYDVQIVGNLAYIANGYSGLQIIDITNPATPTLKGSYNTIDNAIGVQIVGNLAYIADGYSGLQIIDITNPATPILKGNYDTIGIAYDVQIVGNLAYIADFDSGLQIIDITDPATPTLRSSYDTSGNAHDVQIVMNLAYIADEHSGLQIIDIINPDIPILRSSYDTDGYATGVQIVENLAYIADLYSGLQIIDNTATPTLRSSYDTNDMASDVQIVGNLAYIADGLSGLQIIDITIPSTPTFKGSYDTNDDAWGVQIVGNLAYIADGLSGLQIIDITNPATPILTGNYDTNGSAYGVQIVGNLAYIADGLSGLQIIDITNPATPILKGNYDTSGYAIGVQIVGNLAYIADYSSGLQIIDITNPATPTLKGSYNTSGIAYDVQVVGNLVYVADYDSGLQIIDITNPATPILKGNYDTSSYAIGVQIVGNLAYIADGWSGLQIIDITDPATPTLRSSYDTSDYAIGVQIVGNLAYVPDGEGGLKIIDVSDLTNIGGNQSPTNITLSNSSINENLAVGTLVGNLTTTDPDTGNTFTYSLVTGAGATDNASFAIVGNQLTNNAVFDYETKNSYSIRLRTTDQGGLSFEKAFTITVTNANTTPTNLTLSNSNIAENQVIGTVIGNLTTTDPDVGNTFTYSLVTGTGSTDNASFTIVGNQLTNNAVFDYETKNSYSIRLRTTDQGGLSFEKAFTITVTNVNETPTNLTLSNSNIAENQVIGTVIGNLSTSDPDVGNTFTYSLIAGTGSTDNALFSITGNQLKTKAIFNFETKNNYSIRLRTTDQGGLFYEQQLTIGVTNVNETPTNLTLSNSNIAENQVIGTVVGNLNTTDVDAGNTFTYTLVAGTGSTDNASFTIVGNQLQTNGVFNFETKKAYSIRVRTTDQNGLFFEKVLPIAVTNVNESPTNIKLSATTVAENLAVGTLVGNLTSTDPDASNTFTYSLVAGTGSIDNASFTVVGTQLKTNAIFNFENKSSYSILLRSTDQGGLYFDKAFTIGVTNVNETPTNLTLSNNIIDENKAINTVIGTLTTTDPDASNTFTYSLVTGTGATDNALFSITGNQLKNNAVFDYETKNSYSIRVRTTDQNGLFVEKQLTININNIDYTVTGTINNENFTATSEKDTIDGQGGNDTVTATFANLKQNDYINGNIGTDTLIITGGTNLDTISIDANSIINQADILGTTILGFENFNLSGFLGETSFSGTINADVIKTGAGDDYIITGDGNDNLDGGSGNDILIGGNGNDIYVVDSVGDVIAEALNAGIDTVQSSISYTLRNNLETLTLTGTNTIDGTGNNLNNTITGNAANNTLIGNAGIDTLTGAAGNDILVGGIGNDILTGGLGADIFRFNATNEGLDNIKDFKVAELDIIQVSASGFAGGLVVGTLSASQFISGAGITAANNSSQRFIYNTTNGALFYDADGNGLGSSALQIATLTGLPAITNSHIQIIA